MKPYYKDRWVTIYHGDSREIIPELPKADLVLTDPPYGRNEIKRNASRGNKTAARDYGPGTWDREPVAPDLLAMVIDHAKHSIIFGGNYFDLPPSSCWLVWDKDNGGTNYADCELAWTNFDTAVRLYRWRWSGMNQEPGAPKEYRVHPTQKPVGLFSQIIADYSKRNEIILDPFLGSGTTAFCAKKLNRDCIGIEMDERYCEAAAKRCSQTVMEFAI